MVYELPKRKSFLLTTVLFSADCVNQPWILVDRARHFQENRRETGVSHRVYARHRQLARLLIIKKYSDACCVSAVIKFNELSEGSDNEDEFSELWRDDSRAMSLYEIPG